jgi:hypothetical protein
MKENIIYIAHYPLVSFKRFYIHIYNSDYVKWVTLELRPHNSVVNQFSFSNGLHSPIIFLHSCFTFLVPLSFIS